MQIVTHMVSDNHSFTPTVALILDTRRAKKGDIYPVKIRITYRRKSRNYRTGQSLTIREFEKVQAGKYLGSLEAVHSDLMALVTKAKDKCKELPQFTP